MAILYDQFGREIKVAKRPETREIAVAAVRDRWSTYPSSGLTPERLAAIFKEADAGDVFRQAEMFEEMEEKDPHIYSQLQTRKNAVMGCDYDIAPWSDSADDKKTADFCKDVLFNLAALEEASRDMLDAIGKGFSMSEIKWGIDGGKAVIQGLSWIHAKKAVFYDRGAADPWAKSFEVPRIVTEAEPWKGEEMPAFKLLYHRYKARSGYDTRAGVLRVCSWMYLFKNYGIKDWVAFAEIFGHPLRLGKYDPGASQADKDALVDAVRSLGTDAAGIISKSTEIEFVESIKGGKADNVFLQLAEFCDKQVSKAILGQTATTEGTPGKLGNEDAQDKVRHDLIEDDSEALCKTIRHQLIRPLVGYNFGWDKPLPWFKIDYQEPEDLEQLGTVYKNLSEIGYPLTQEHISERFKVPLPGENETLLKKTAENPLPEAQNSPVISSLRALLGDSALGRVVGAIGKNRGLKSPLMQSFDPEQQVLEALKLKMAGNWEEMLGPYKAAVEEALSQAADFEDAKGRLQAAFSELDDTAAMELIARSIFAADAWGRING